jgi:hypothetical protein
MSSKRPHRNELVDVETSEDVSTEAPAPVVEVAPQGSIEILAPLPTGKHPLEDYVFPHEAYVKFLEGDKSAVVYDPTWGVHYAAK